MSASISVWPAGKWRLYWGAGPLPEGASAHGTVCRGCEVGALIKTAAGIYCQGNASVLRSLPQAAVRRAVDPAPISAAAAALGRLGRGKPKHYSPEERARRAELARGLAARRKAATLCACGKPVGDGLCLACRLTGK